jgi:hypothetical protein
MYVAILLYLSATPIPHPQRVSPVCCWCMSLQFTASRAGRARGECQPKGWGMGAPVFPGIKQSSYSAPQRIQGCVETWASGLTAGTFSAQLDTATSLFSKAALGHLPPARLRVALSWLHYPFYFQFTNCQLIFFPIFNGLLVFCSTLARILWISWILVSIRFFRLLLVYVCLLQFFSLFLFYKGEVLSVGGEEKDYSCVMRL